MTLTTEEKKEVIQQHQKAPNDSGSAEVQIALLTHDINKLQKHFEVNTKDNHSRRGLLHKVNTRRKLLDYLKRKDESSYKTLIEKLGLRR